LYQGGLFYRELLAGVKDKSKGTKAQGGEVLVGNHRSSRWLERPLDLRRGRGQVGRMSMNAKLAGGKAISKGKVRMAFLLLKKTPHYIKKIQMFFEHIPRKEQSI